MVLTMEPPVLDGFTLPLNRTLPLERKEEKEELVGRTGVVGFGAYVPDRVVSNTEVGRPAGVDDAWIMRKTAIEERRWVANEEATSDLALAAAKAALRDSGLTGDDVDLVVVATSTPDYPQPPTAALVQAGLGARNAAAYDVNAVCSGFEFALNTTSELVAATDGTALVIGADVYSRIIDPTDRRTAILFGDGAGAVLLQPAHRIAGHSHTMVAGKMLTIGEYSDVIRVPGGGSRLPLVDHSIAADSCYFQMQGRRVREFVIERVPGIVHRFLDEVGVDMKDVSHFVPHQANGVMLTELFDALGLPNATQHLTVGRLGNTGAASIPITLAQLSRSGEVQAGDLILLAAFGGGMSIGLTLMQW